MYQVALIVEMYTEPLSAGLALQGWGDWWNLSTG
jgi:hypothetical protein